MKQKQTKQQQVWRPGSSLFVKLFALVVMMISGVNGAWGQTSKGKVEIPSTITANSTDWQYIGKNGIIKSVHVKGTAEVKNPAGCYVKITDKGFFKLCFDTGTVFPGDELRVNVGPSGDNSDDLGYVVEGSNTFVNAGNTGTKYTQGKDVNYTLKSSDIQKDPDNSNTDMIVINRSGGGYAYAYHSFEIVRSGYLITWKTEKLNGADAWYTLGNDNAQYRESRSGIPAGTKVVCHAQDNDGSYIFFNRWFDGSDASYGWGNRNFTFTEGIDKDLTIGAEFFTGRIYVGNVQGGNGSVEVHTWNSTNNAFNDNNINGQKEIWSNRVQFEAKASDGYEFVRWAEDNSTNPLLELTDVPTAQTITRTAIFQQISSTGFVFENNGADVYNFSGSYQQTISGATLYSITHKYGAIASTNIDINSDGSLTNLPSYNDNKGGAIVVEATGTVNGETKKASYVLTIPYKKYVWNFYKQGLTGNEYNQVLGQKEVGAEGNKNHFTFGDLLAGVSNPGSAPEQPATADIPNEGSTYPKKYATDAVINATDPKTREYNTQQDLKKMLKWLTDQGDQSIKNNPNDPHNYWNYTYKTIEHLDKVSSNPISYTNEAIFSYKNAVKGDNARIISDTQGLVFDCDANKFGMNDNLTATFQDDSEQDRSILLKGYSSFTVPHVTQGHYIKIHWYRHSENAGDQFKVTNANDLDGKAIDPDHILRFTSAHYTHHNWEGSLILQAASTGDVTITIANANWTELFRIEVTDTYESDQKLCESIVYKPTGGTPYSLTTVGFERDINDVTVYNRTRLSVGDIDYGEVRVNQLVSRVRTNAQGGGLISSPEDLYFSGYAAQCNTWNGWMNNRVSAEFDGTARCDVQYDSENGLSNILPVEYIRIGKDLDYPMHPLKNVKGVGTIKLTMRTITGNDGEPHYTLNKQVAYVPVGEYSVQNYPYTWDFTKYNTGLTNAYSSSYKTLDMFNSNQNNANHYGYYSSGNGMNVNAAQDVQNGYAYIAGHKAPESAKRNKRLFAQGAQLALGDGNCHTILETEGLRINIPAVDDAHNGAVSLVGGSSIDEGYLTICANGKITIPEVDKDMYVFVKGTTPASATNTASFSGISLENAQSATDPIVLVKDNKVMNAPWGQYNDGGKMQKMDEFTSKSYQLKIEPVTIAGQSNTYTIKLNEDGNYKRYLQASKWGHAFFNSNYDNDGTNCAVWTIEQMSDGKYSIRSLGVVQDAIRADNNDGYLCVNGANELRIDSKNPVGWEFSTYNQQKMVSFESNSNVTYYKATGDGSGGKADVTLIFDTDATIYKIGVTNQIKNIAYFGYATESRAMDIDYNETRYFSANTSGHYLTSKDGWNSRIDGNVIDTDKDLQLQLTSSPIQDRTYIAQGTGIILKDEQVTYSKVDKDKNSATKYTIPLFVPACNIPATNNYSYAKENLLTASTSRDHESADIYTSLEGESNQYYTMSNRCVEVDKDNNHYDNTNSGVFIYTDTPRFYRYVGTGTSGEKATLKNMAYLVMTSNAAKRFGIALNIYFDDDFDDPTAIESVESDIIESTEDGVYYNLRGQAINGRPTAKGVYIKNGKKYYVK